MTMLRHCCKRPMLPRPRKISAFKRLRADVPYRTLGLWRGSDGSSRRSSGRGGFPIIVDALCSTPALGIERVNMSLGTSLIRPCIHVRSQCIGCPRFGFLEGPLATRCFPLRGAFKRRGHALAHQRMFVQARRCQISGSREE
jgi:hypothetical protein